MSKTQNNSNHKSKSPLYISEPFIAELKAIFQSNPKISPAKALLDKLKETQLPQKWTVNTIKAELTKNHVIYYVRTKPAGYVLDENRLAELIQLHKPSHTDLIDEVIASSSQKVEKNNELALKEEGSTVEKVYPQESSKENKNESVEDILDRIPAFSSYLLNRMSTDAQKSLRMGILEMNSLSVSKLDNKIEHLSSARMFYDGNYVKEQVLIEFIDDKIRYLSQLKEKMHETEAENLIHKIFTEKLVKGKFEKIVSKWGSETNIDETAWRCVEKLGRKRNKIPLSDFALRQRVSEILKKRYPEKEI
ncbi:hypothetical protein NEF87_001797 [Candidatus Lokiarchaeum ossiferum]|uniref:HTH HARE-type domain-containing protein n=1 Tax=Candidatus Lokiarchaeum ossiferum TaxID=2951803 RepID=A0ABY6HPT4_9ARCH|nr:hypothetical protein NEF87_001797 [Candidatus Lokiarchaeum sp. B-35]